MADAGTPEYAAEALKEGWPGGLPVADYGKAVAMVLAAMGWKPKPPKHQRVGRLVAGLLKEHGPMTYAQIEKAARLSAGSVANGLKTCGAVVVRQQPNGKKGKGGGKPVNWYGLPGVHGQEVRHAR